MPRGVPNTAVLDVNDETMADEYLDGMGQLETAFQPIRAYNMTNDLERVLIPDKDPGKSDPELRKRIQFYGGNYLVRNKEEYDALANKSDVVFEDFPKDAPDQVCPRCQRPFRNMQAFNAHVLTHME